MGYLIPMWSVHDGVALCGVYRWGGYLMGTTHGATRVSGGEGIPDLDGVALCGVS